jgi:phosphate transport system substrate-binding protein
MASSNGMLKINKYKIMLIIMIILLYILISSCTAKSTQSSSLPLPSENTPDEKSQSSSSPLSSENTPEKEFLLENFDKFVIDGSTSMLPLHQVLRERFSSNNSMVKHSKTVEAFDYFLSGKVHILLSVDYSDELIERAKKNGIMLARKEITKEGFVFLINRNNIVQNLTLDQIKDIYSGKIINWNQVGGDDVPIKAYQRNSDSGSQIRMLKLMGENELINRTDHYFSEMGYVIKAINDYDSGKYSIAYNMYTFTEKQYPSEYVILLAVNGVYPTDESIFNETYPIVIKNYIYYDSNNQIVSEFVDKLYTFLMTDEGQKLINDSGYININKQYKRNLNIYNKELTINDVEYIDLGWWNKEKSEFYELDYEDKELLVFYNFPDYVLHNTGLFANKNARDFVTLCFNSNYELDQRAVSAWNDTIRFSIWWDASFDPEDFVNFKYNQKYYIGLSYYPNEDKYVLNVASQGTIDSYRENMYGLSEEKINNIANSEIVLKREDIKNIYFRSRRINQVTNEFDYYLLF